MNVIPLPFDEFQVKGAFDFSSTCSSSNSSILIQNHQQNKCHNNNNKNHNNNKEGVCHVGYKSTSINTRTRSRSPPTSFSTLSSSYGEGSRASTESSGVAATNADNNEKCGLGMEDWESVLPRSPSQEQSVLGLIMNDMDDPSVGLNKILHSSQDMEFNAGFGLMDQGFMFEFITSVGNLVSNINNSPSHQVPKDPFSGSWHEFYPRLQQQQTQLQAAKPVSDEMANQQLQQGIMDQLIKAAELIETEDQVLAQGILARLNHQLSPVGKPFIRAAFYFKEALQLLLRLNPTDASALSTYNMILKIGAYKSFSEISPLVQFANFTCNQALLEAFEGCGRIHVIDFDVGYGGQWPSLMQELVLRNGGAPSMKITAFASASSHDELEHGFTQGNLKHYASEINMDFDIEIMSLESLNSCPWPLHPHFAGDEAIAVNLPIGSFSNHPSTLPMVLRFVKQLSPKIVVSLDRGCDRTDVTFPHHIIHGLQSYSGLLESLDAVNMNLDALEKIERFFLHPRIENIVLDRHRSLERRPPWRNLFSQYGLSPLTFSNFTESQAECLIQRSPIRGFHVEKKQSSLVLCWLGRELIAASAWRC